MTKNFDRFTEDDTVLNLVDDRNFSKFKIFIHHLSKDL